MCALVVRRLVCGPFAPFPLASPPHPGCRLAPVFRCFVSRLGSSAIQASSPPPPHLTLYSLPPFCIPSTLVVTVSHVFGCSYHAEYIFLARFTSPRAHLSSCVCMTSFTAATSTLPEHTPQHCVRAFTRAVLVSTQLFTIANAPANVPANANAKDDLRDLVRPRNGRGPANAPAAGATTPKRDRVPKRRVVIESNTGCIACLGWCHRGHVFDSKLAPAVAWECHRCGSS
jgi:hypothetical protein